MRFFAANVLLQHLDANDLTRFKSEATSGKNKKSSLSRKGDGDEDTRAFSIVFPPQQLTENKTNAKKKEAITKTLMLRRVSIDERLLWLCQLS